MPSPESPAKRITTAPSGSGLGARSTMSVIGSPNAVVRGALVVRGARSPGRALRPLVTRPQRVVAAPLLNVHPRPGKRQDTRSPPTGTPLPTVGRGPPWRARHRPGAGASRRRPRNRKNTRSGDARGACDG
jgi:hypothetical protein